MKRKVQLYIAGRQVDLGDDSWILYNWTKEDLTNPTAVVNSSSHQIQIPGTCRNNSLFGSVFRLDRRTILGIRYDGVNFDPMRKTPFILYDDSGVVLESGYCRLDEVNTRSRKHAYTISLFGGLGSMFYALAYGDDGAERSLASLIWEDTNGDDVTDFEVAPEAATVGDAWGYLETGAAEVAPFWNVVNFAPAYNGLPEDFDASHALMNEEAYANLPSGMDEDGERGYEYTYKAGLDCALVSFTNPHTEWELCDLRWYLQRPVVSVKSFITAICDPRNNGGYTVTLDPAFFNDDNPAYAEAWWTLGMVASEDRGSGAFLTNVLKASKTPMAYLVDYCKTFGLAFLWDSGTRSVRIVTRATFYGENANMLDLTDRVDRGQSISQDPLLADTKWYQLGEGGKGEFAEQYARDYGKGYGVQRIDTGYEFDAGTKVLTDGQTFKNEAEVQESNLLFSEAARIVSGRTWARYFQLPRYEGVTVELWNEDGESKSFDMQCDMEANYWDVPETHGADWLPKLQLHGEDNKSVDGADVLIYFLGVKDTPVYSSGSWNVHKSYFLTNDDPAMIDLAGGPCWDMRREHGGGSVWLVSLPSFRRVFLSGRYIVESFEWGVPEVRPVMNVTYPTGNPTTLYRRWWESYLEDRYDKDTRVMTAMVNLRGWEVGQGLLRRFYWYDGAVWVLNAIRNHSMTSWDLTECEFVKVKDRRAYISGPGEDLTKYLMITPDAASFSLNPSGETLILSVKSSSTWSLSLSTIVSWLTTNVVGGPEGVTSLQITATANTAAGSRRNVTVTLTNLDGEVLSFNLSQTAKTADSISLSPPLITIPATGTETDGVPSRGRSSRVTASGGWDVDSTTIPAWLKPDQGGAVIKSEVGLTIKAGANSGSERTASIKVYLTGDPDMWATLSVIQEAGEGGTGGITLTDGNGNTSATVQSTGGSLTLYVTVPDGDGWTITKSENWVSVSPVSGSGNGQLAVTIPAYSGNEDRPATITAKRDGYTEGAIFYIIQAAPAVSQDEIEIVRYPANWFYNNLEAGAAGGGYAATLKASGSWSASLGANSSWIHPQTQYGDWSGGATSDTTLWFSIDPNTGAARTGTIIGTCGTATATFYVYQAGDGTLTLAASFNKSSIDASAQEVYLIIQATSGLAWTIDNVSSGLSPARNSGTGSAEVKCDVSAYGGSTYRDLSARVYVNSSLKQTASVRQNAAASADYIRVTPFGTINMIAADTRQEFAVDCSTSWRCQTSAPGVSISPSTGNGSGTVVVTFDPNESTDPVTIPLTFSTTNGSGKTASATIVQAGAASQSIAVNPSTVNLSAVGTAQTVLLSATGSWTASKSDSWISVSPVSGSAGNGQTITISAGSNSGQGRGGRVTFTCGNKTAVLTVNQASNLELEVSPTSVTLSSADNSHGSVTVYASGSWSITSTLPAWVSVSGSTAGSLEGEVLTFTSKSPNNSAIPRTGSVTIALDADPTITQTISISQEGQVILYASPTSVNVFAYQGAGATQITCNTSWQVLSHSEDIVIEDGTESGTGDGEVSWFAKGNPTSSARILTIVIETTDHTRTATVTINQSAGLLMSDTDNLVLAGNGDSATVFVQSSDPWSVVGNTVPSWLSISPMGGSQSFNELVFTVGANPYNFDRSQVVTIQNSYGKSIYITVTQRGLSSETLSISPETVTLNSSGVATGSLSIVSSTAWYIEPSDEMMFSESSGTGSKTVTWTLGDNPMAGYREIQIVVRTEDGGIVKRCTIWQPGDSPASITFLPDTDSLTFYYSAAAVTKTVKMRVIAKQGWIASADEGWLNASPNSGSAGQIVEVTFTPTISSSVVQIGHWTVTTSSGTRTLTITTLPI